MCLAGVFGLLGIHHFYLERWLHGVVDLVLTFVAIYLLVINEDLLGLGVLVIDLIHTLIIMTMLLIGTYRDGQGRVVTYPGQDLGGSLS